MLLRVLSPSFLASYWSAGFGRFLQVSTLASHWLEDFANFTPTPEENSANYSKCNTSSKPVHFYQYTIILHIVISSNDKNKQLTLLSQPVGILSI
jgi:hypothetical protein